MADTEARGPLSHADWRSVTVADTEARGSLSHADWRSVTEVPETTAETGGSRAQHKWGLGRRQAVHLLGDC